MSDRDKKLLVYLGALIIFAAAYFLCAKPFLDKIDVLSSERTQLDATLRTKQEAFANQEQYKTGTEEARNKMQSIIDRFPEDNTDEKSIMFIHHAEKEIPIWVGKIQFAEETKTMVNGQEVESASDAEQVQLEQNVAAAEGESVEQPAEASAEEDAAATQQDASMLAGMMSRDTELGVEFTAKYEEFKKFLAYIRDYEDRLVIKDAELSYDEKAGLVHGQMVISQYAILADDRVLPKVESGVDKLGTDNVFLPKDKSGGILDIIADAMSDLFNRIMGGLSTEAAEEFAADYFLRVNAVTDNTSGKTLGRAGDVQQSTFVISDENGEEDVSFALSGSDGTYKAKYSIGDEVYEDTIEKDEGSTLYLRVVSTERMSDSDDVSVLLHVINDSDIPVTVAIEGDDDNNPRVEVIEQDGDVTVR